MNIFSHQNVGTTEEKGQDAKRTILSGTNLIGDICKTTLGPKGMLKILKGDTKNQNISNDGAFILKNLQIDSASARIIINSSIGQDWEEGDGTTSVAVLSSILINEISKLNIHPIKIIRGLRMAQERCEKVLNKISSVPTDEDIKSLINTTLCSKVLKYDLEKFTNMCIKAVEGLEGKTDLNLIQIIKCPGKLEDSYLDDGFILNKEAVIKTIKNPKILLANTSLDQDKIKVFGAKINVSSVSDLAEMERIERDKMNSKIENICQNKIDCFINRQLIYDYPMQLLKNKGVQPIENADFDGIERLNNVLGGKILSTFDNLDESVYGTCEEIKNVNIGGKKFIKFSGIKNGASTIVLFGSSKEMLDEAERSLHDALCVLIKIKENPKIVYGGGSSEMALAVELAKYALEIPGVESEAISAFSSALQNIPVILSENGGFNGNELKSQLRSKHNSGAYTYGVNLEKGVVQCMKECHVVDSFRIKKRVICASSEVAQMIIKCDGIVKLQPRERTRH
ncbi:T-complex protein 1 subunit beta (CCT2) [Vairimorpha necatrix]|uniref:T-complex protein 1 subunit beta (CCT2) n=1 Tax=Vairimorpha necatrix TaxID=6039 RepID=A0AAX4JA45_9MICR